MHGGSRNQTGWDPVNRAAAIAVPGRREGSVSVPAEWGCQPAVLALRSPLRAPPTSATSELGGAAPVTALHPGRRDARARVSPPLRGEAALSHPVPPR